MAKDEGSLWCAPWRRAVGRLGRRLERNLSWACFVLERRRWCLGLWLLHLNDRKADWSKGDFNLRFDMHLRNDKTVPEIGALPVTMIRTLSNPSRACS